MAVKRKFYVVWNGVAPGIYDSWEECQLQIKGYPDAPDFVTFLRVKIAMPENQGISS
jgi:viroplasmin and RNaseH domain-containing protein